MAFVAKQDETPDPLGVGFFSTVAVMPGANPGLDIIQQSGRLTCFTDA
jgi:hypothetical protein